MSSEFKIVKARCPARRLSGRVPVELTRYQSEGDYSFGDSFLAAEVPRLIDKAGLEKARRGKGFNDYQRGNCWAGGRLLGSCRGCDGRVFVGQRVSERLGHPSRVTKVVLIRHQDIRGV